jgi:NAD(P)-dependent dehydrogenase (short-subunit alcohol dehydrogenase family)
MKDSPITKTILVTGASKRIGESLTQELAKNGWSIAIHYYRSKKDAQHLMNEINDTGGKANIFEANLSDVAETQQLISKVTKEMGSLHALINNASIFAPEEWNDVTLESWGQNLSINLHAPFILSQAFAQQSPQPLAGVIINIIDQCVLNLTPHFFSYTISKSALWTLTQTLARALAPRIRVNAIGPGPTLPNTMQSREDFLKQARNTPLERQVPLEEINKTVIYLLNAQAVTGQMIAVDSGEHLS